MDLMTRFVMGVDGGGSTVRVAIFDAALNPLVEVTGPNVNPSVIGLDPARDRVHAAIHAALDQAGLPADAIGAVGLGIAGAADTHAGPWVRGTAAAVLPAACIVTSADYEIALVGAHGQPYGALVLAGTGSVAYGINAQGQKKLVSGWGYLLGDEGSGYWLGAQGLRAATRMVDGRGPATQLTARLLDALALEKPLDLIAWLYRGEEPRMKAVAALAPLVLDSAASGDAVARRIVEQGALELALAIRAVMRGLEMVGAPVAFAGSLLRQPNPMSDLLCELLGLDAIPETKYSPVTGAAILALHRLNT